MKQACAVAALIGLLVVSLVAPSPAGAQDKKKGRRPVTCIETPAGAFIATPGRRPGPLPQVVPPALGGFKLTKPQTRKSSAAAGLMVQTLRFNLAANRPLEPGIPTS